MASSKPAKVIATRPREQKSPTRKTPTEMARKPSSSILKNSQSERKVSVAASARKVSVASSSSSGRKVSVTTKARNLPGTLTRKTSNCSDRFIGGHSGPAPSLLQRPPAASSSVVGFRQLLVTKRLARNLKLRTAQRMAERRGRSFITYSDRPGRRRPSPGQDVLVEPSYQVRPPQKFGEFQGAISDILEELIPETLSRMPYDALVCSRQAKSLAGDIQERVKDLRIARYKLITVVHIGEIQQQAIRVCSRGIWDVEVDSFVTYQYQNASLYCVATVFGIYHE
ncbi:uncharacterized protein LOC110989684 [Acanthaster planci]|uniref:Uncharacterized protein LOC110989684 n=1 Tax=Acanthaster planci TaxID=133434 RepID=A0A8B7ZX00_ACAPL|nr:uncharacterized protein LOC110989684 [Acanthaster planci]